MRHRLLNSGWDLISEESPQAEVAPRGEVATIMQPSGIVVPVQGLGMVHRGPKDTTGSACGGPVVLKYGWLEPQLISEARKPLENPSKPRREHGDPR
jgi:hypothetical protein